MGRIRHFRLLLSRLRNAKRLSGIRNAPELRAPHRLHPVQRALQAVSERVSWSSLAEMGCGSQR